MAVATQTSRGVDTVHEPVPTSPAQIRRGLRAVLAQWGVPAEVAEKALMVVEELVANAVDHARTPFRLTVDHVPGDESAGLEGDGPSLRIVVRDQCARPLDVRPFSAHASRGRGLHLIEALTSRWGWDQTSAGKAVWAVLAA